MIESILNESIKVGRLDIPNRVVIQPMEGCDGTLEGSISPLTRRRYLRFARSGVGLIWFEATSVCKEGRANPRQLYLTEETKADFKALLDEMKKTSMELFGYAPVIIIQLNHSGRQSRPIDKPRPIYGSDNAYLDVMKPLAEGAVYADTEYLRALPAQYVHSAELAYEVGFDGVDVKCCHGYLFNEMMGAYSRTDEYGGASIDNRARLYLDTYRAVNKAVGDKMEVTSRFGAYDGFDYPYGFGVNANNDRDLKEAYYVIDKLIEEGISLLNITIGNPYVNPHVNRPYRAGSPEDGKIGVERMREITREIQEHYPDLTIIMSGMSYNGADSMKEAEACIENGYAKMVGYGRMAFAYPEFFVDYMEHGEIDKKKVCVTCGTCSKMMRAGGVAGCPIRDREGYGEEFARLFPRGGKN